MSLRDRLRRLRREDAVPEPIVTTGLDRTPGPPAGLEEFDGPAGKGLARITRFDVDHRHGEFQLSEVRGASLGDFVLLTGDEQLHELELHRAVYLDTETTGLSGGAGTYVFQVGLGTFRKTPDGRELFEVWQGFLPGPEGERALLAESASRLLASSGVVSFFGKSFDRHRLEDKMRLNDVPPPFEDLPHLDLYHPCRRLYREAYPDSRLKTLELELCGLHRADDLPGSMAPAAWFDYLAGRPHLLEGVFRHNLDDVLSLVTLAAHLGQATSERRMDGAQLGGDEATRALGVSRSLARSGQRREAREWLELAVERGAGCARALGRERADLMRLAGEWELAIDAYGELVAGAEDGESAMCLVELAKLLEHRRGDVAGALECCRVAEGVLERNHTGRERERLREELERRVRRLVGKRV